MVYARKGIRSLKNVAPKLFMMAQLEHGNCTARSTVLAAPPAMVKDKSGEGGQTAVGLDPINEGVQPDVLQRGRAGMSRQRSKSQDVRTAAWNVSSMVSRSGEVVDALHRRNIDFCCAQETRWKGECARILAAIGLRYKFFWQGCNKGTAGVGVFIAERWIDSAVNVVRVNERIMYVKLVIGKQIGNSVSAYAPQVGLSAEEKDDFWDSFIIVLSGIPKHESIFIGSDMNGHVGRDADGYGGVHGGIGFGTRNAEGERILEFGDAVDMVVCNTFFKKKDSKLITYQSGDNRSMIEYLMVRKTYRCLVKGVKVISSEECVPQHRMVIGRLVLPMKPQKKKIVMFVQKPRVWKMRKLLDCSLMKWQLEMMKLLKLMTSKRSGY